MITQTKLIGLFLWLGLSFAAANLTLAQGHKVGDVATSFKLKNVDGKMVSLEEAAGRKGAVVIFTCNHCPFAKAYEDRIIAYQRDFAAQGLPVIAINPNDPKLQPEDNFEAMQKRAKDKIYNFPYLVDETQGVAKAYGATRTPHVFLLRKEGKDFKVAYVGAIDDNSDNENKVQDKYLRNAAQAVIDGKPVDPSFTKSVGCTIKWRKG